MEYIYRVQLLNAEDESIIAQEDHHTVAAAEEAPDRLRRGTPELIRKEDLIHACHQCHTCDDTKQIEVQELIEEDGHNQVLEPTGTFVPCPDCVGYEPADLGPGER